MNLINLEAYETLENGFAFLIVYYVDRATKANRINHKKVTGFPCATTALRAGYDEIFSQETAAEWTQANYSSSKFKKTYTYTGIRS